MKGQPSADTLSGHLRRRRHPTVGGAVRSGVQGALGHKQKPQCVHISNVHADLLPTDVYSGMYARVTVNFFPYDASGNRGVGYGLGAVSVR